MSRLHVVFHQIDLVILNLLGGITQTSQLRVGIIESDVLLMCTVFLLILASVATVLYYRRITETRAKYEEARDVVGDVVVSFSKQLQRHEEQLEKANYRIQGLSAKSDSAVLQVNALGKQASDLTSKVANTSEAQDRLKEDIEDVRARLNEMRKTQEDFIKQVSETPEAKVEAAIPIKREHALAPLTETELRVLEFIAEKGEKTAPEIRDLTRLTREHSARLVKKLYEEGYLERDTGKTPYRYRVKDEMLKLLKKNEAKV